MNRRIIIFCLAFLIALFYALAIPSFASLPSSSTGTIASVQTPEQQGKALYDAGRFAEAVLVLQQAAQQYQQQGDSLRQAIVLSNLALTYQQLGNGQSAKQVIQESLDLLDDLPSTTDRVAVQAQVLDVQGRLQFTQGQAEAALAAWQQAAQFYEQLEDAAGLAANQIDQSRALQALGFYQRAIDLLVQVLSLPSQIPVDPEQQLGFNQTSISLEELLGIDPSLMTQNNRVDVLRTLLPSLSPTRNTVIALQALAEVLRGSGSLGQAEAILQHALEMAKLLGASDVVAAIQLDLGNVTRAQAAIQDNLDDIPQAQEQLDNQALKKLEELAAALDYYRQAAEAGGITGVRAELNELSFHLDRAEYADKDISEYAAAQQLVPQIQQHLDALPDGPVVVYAQINFAQSRVKLFGKDRSNLSQVSEIENLLDQIQQQAGTLNDSRALSYAMGIRGHLYEMIQNWTAAEQFTREALSTAQGLVSVPEQGFITAPNVRYLWQWQLGRILKAQTDQSKDESQYQEAVIAYEEAIEILRSLRLDLVAANQDEQFNFRDSIEPAYREYIQLLLRSAPISKLSEQLNAPNLQVQDQLKKARQSLQDLQTAELQNFLREACINIPTIDLDKIVNPDPNHQLNSQQNNSRNALTALIYPIILPDQLSVVLKLPQSEQQFNRPSLLHYSTKVEAQVVQATLKKLREQLTQPETFQSDNDFEEAEKLYDWLIRPATEVLRQEDINTLAFVLDGALQLVPMAALYDKQAKQYLVQQYNTALAPGLEIRQPQLRDEQELKLLFAGLSDSVEIDGESFSALDAANEQAQAIQQESEAAGYTVDTLWNKDFTVKKLQNKLQNKLFQIVHLVTHGKFSSNQDGTFLIDFQRKVRVAELRQLLQMRDQSQPQPIDLLILSACETATGDPRAALGMAGVAVQSGAHSTLATLWGILGNDAKILLPEFYRQLRDSNQSKAEALSKAQRIFLDSSNQTLHHPIHWASFVLLGNWL